MAKRGSCPSGIVLCCALVLAGCASAGAPGEGGGDAAGVGPAAPSPEPSARSAWAQALRFSGDVQGTLSQAVPGDASRPTECTGATSRYAGAWASAVYGPLGHDLYGVVVTVRPYRGPGTYRTPDVAVQVLRPADASAVWQTAPGDAATFSVDTGEQTGALDATLTNLSSNTTKLHVGGRWSCPG